MGAYLGRFSEDCLEACARKKAEKPDACMSAAERENPQFRTRVVQKVEGPSWRPTPSMKRRNPEWPDYVGPGPDNPLGTRALHLSWTYYRIHGTHDTRKIGRRSSNGCIGLYNEHISELFGLAKVGTQVLVI